MANLIDLIQGTREISLTTPLGPDVLLFQRMQVHEALAQLPHFELDMLSKDPNLKLDALIGRPITVSLNLPNFDKRYFHGYVTRFSHTGTYQDFISYRATVHPWLWFLTRSADCRIYQNMTVPDIVKQVFRDHGFSDFTESLSGKYRTWEYCVQYRETDFNFVSRLMEQEGIYYYFTYEKDRSVLVLSDSIGSHDVRPGYERIPFFPPDHRKLRTRDHIYGWETWQEAQTGALALNDYDFEKPRANLKVKSMMCRPHPMGDLEVFEYPGQYGQYDDGESYVRIRLQELQCQYEQVGGVANARGLTCGGLFSLTQYPRIDQNREYLITAATHQLETSEYGSSSAATPEVYTCRFTAISSEQQFRPARRTPKPAVQGLQTAVVVGPSGEEIYTDKHGRVKVQFHWDRYGKKDEKSSCWVRVSQVHAGTGFGGISIPRIGEEVLVSFLEGDPDRPMITGRAYNTDNMPPYDLPANQTQSGLKSRSSKGGTGDNCNEIRFEDKKGAEQLLIHAEKNQDIEVENDETHWVGHDRTKTVDHDETVHVKHDRTETVDNNETITIGANRSVTIGGNKTETISIAKAESIGAAKALSIGAGYAVTVGGAMNTAVGLAQFEEVGHSKTTLVGKKYTINAGDELEITVGKSSLVMKSDGTVLINGSQFDFSASGPVQISGKDVDIN